MSEVGPRHRHISQRKWAGYRDEFEFQYLFLRKPLEEVRTHMREQMGLDASARQYKAQIKRWGMRKYNTSNGGHLTANVYGHSDGHSSAFSSEVDADDNYASLGVPSNSIDGNEGNSDHQATRHSQTAAGELSHRQDTSITTTARLLFPQVPAHLSRGLVRLPQIPLDQIDPVLRADATSHRHWQSSYNETTSVQQRHAVRPTSNTLAATYDELGVLSTLNNSTARHAPARSSNRRTQLQHQQSQGDSFETIDSTPQSIHGYHDEYSFPSNA